MSYTFVTKVAILAVALSAVHPTVHAGLANCNIGSFWANIDTLLGRLISVGIHGTLSNTGAFVRVVSISFTHGLAAAS